MREARIGRVDSFVRPPGASVTQRSFSFRTLSTSEIEYPRMITLAMMYAATMYMPLSG